MIRKSLNLTDRKGKLALACLFVFAVLAGLSQSWYTVLHNYHFYQLGSVPSPAVSFLITALFFFGKGALSAAMVKLSEEGDVWSIAGWLGILETVARTVFLIRLI